VNGKEWEASKGKTALLFLSLRQGWLAFAAMYQCGWENSSVALLARLRNSENEIRLSRSVVLRTWAVVWV
jgi:hypothetical protein